jgi:hypothetical protein
MVARLSFGEAFEIDTINSPISLGEVAARETAAAGFTNPFATSIRRPAPVPISANFARPGDMTRRRFAHPPNRWLSALCLAVHRSLAYTISPGRCPNGDPC